MTETERAYYDRRAAGVRRLVPWHGTVRSSESVPVGREELAVLKAVLASLRFDSFLDVACGTGFLTESLHGNVTGLDQSASMLAVARSRLPRRMLCSRRCPGNAVPVGSNSIVW